LARAAYCPSDIVLLDDPLSAVDAYVGKAIFDECILRGPLSTRTRVLVTHALHVLDKVDYIYVMDTGAIIEEGTCDVRWSRILCLWLMTLMGLSKALMNDGLAFHRLMEEYGHGEKDEELRVNHPGKLRDATDTKAPAGYDETKLQSPLMQAEVRSLVNASSQAQSVDPMQP
jgi:ATP-binding cassette subfamily C (CFTR/MRP) protein 1